MKVGRIVALLVVFVLFGTCGYSDADCITGAKYQAMGDGTVQDCQTGLIWLLDANCETTIKINGVTNSASGLSWPDALKWVDGLYGDGSGDTVCSLSDGSSAGDWRLPTKTEWMAMVAYAYKTKGYSNPSLTNDEGTAHWGVSGTSSFTNVHSDGYWSSTTLAVDTKYAWFVYMLEGVMGLNDKPALNYVWPVRGGQSGSFGVLRIE
jgi:hypothetical protein